MIQKSEIAVLHRYSSNFRSDSQFWFACERFILNGYFWRRSNAGWIRHNGVSIEGARAEIRAVAEGVVGQNEKLEAFKKEMEQEFNDTRQLIRPVYSELDQRVRNLETYVDLKKNDPLKIIKEQILGRPPE